MEMEVCGTAFSNILFTALVNRCGKEPRLTFAGKSFITDPNGKKLVETDEKEDQLLLADLNLTELETIKLKRPYLRDRRPGMYELLTEPGTETQEFRLNLETH